VDGVLSVDKKKRRWNDEIKHQRSFFKSLRDHQFDLAINVRTGTRGAFLSFLSGAPCRIGHYCYRHPWTNRLYTHIVQPKEWGGLYAAEQNLTVVAPLNLDIHERIPVLRVPPARKEAALNILRKEKVPFERPLIALHPFSARENKNWGVEPFAALVKCIATKYDFPIIVTGSSLDRTRAMKMTDNGNPKVFLLAGKTSIGELAGVFQLCKILIGVDTGAIHIAAAVGIPTFSICGPTDPAVWKPRGDQHGLVSKHLPCAPCALDGCKNSEIRSCLAQLSVEEVWEKVDKKLERLFQSGPMC
jgi:lipopolysaccharide heptosyltransferase III